MALDTSSLNHGIFFLFETTLVILGHDYQWCWSEDHYIALGSWTDESCAGLPFANASVMLAPKFIGTIAFFQFMVVYQFGVVLGYAVG